MKNRFFLLLTLFPCLLLPAQTPGNVPTPADPVSLIGTTLSDLISRYGAPKVVYPVRGIASWQDDVVFVYDNAGGHTNAEFYIYGNRVWQLKLQSAGGVKQGDPRAAVQLSLGAGSDFEGYSLYDLPSKVWPVKLRINWDSSGRAAGIYIYRSDY